MKRKTRGKLTRPFTSKLYNPKVKKDTLELSFHLLLPVSSTLEFSSNVIYVTTLVIQFPARKLISKVKYFIIVYKIVL